MLGLTFEVFLVGYGESCQHNLHVMGSLFLLGGGGGSLGATGGRVASWATSLVVSTTFSASSNCSGASGEMFAIGRALVGLSLTSSASLETKSTLELEKSEVRMVRG